MAQPGRLLASNCFQCHGTNGIGPGFDDIAGESTDEIYKKLKEFQSGKEGNGIMAKPAMAYTDEQLRLISAWLAKQRAGKRPLEFKLDPAARGGVLPLNPVAS